MILSKPSADSHLQTPRWLIKKNRPDYAAKALSRLRSLPMTHPVVVAELEEITAALEAEREIGQNTYIDCFRSTHNKIALRTCTGIALQAWQQLTGVNFISYCMLPSTLLLAPTNP